MKSESVETALPPLPGVRIEEKTRGFGTQWQKDPTPIIPYYSFKVSELFLDVVLLTVCVSVSRTTSRNNSDTLKE